MSAMNLPLSQIVSALSLNLTLDHDPLVHQIHIDSRKVSQGDVIVALAGERVDGHAFVSLAEQMGAVAVIVTRYLPDVQIPQLLVEDAVLALQTISAFWRVQQALSSCVLVTGSNGKTSVKEMLTACFSAKLGQDHVCATQGNLNNHLGLPLSLLSLRDQHQVGVFEVGANHIGEIAQLSPLAQPTIAMITSIGLAHVGEFGGLSAIKRAKAEIFTALPKQAIAVVPVLSPDDPLDAWGEWQSALVALQPLVFGRLEQVQTSRGWSQWVASVATRIERHGDQLGQVVSITSSHWGNAKVMLPLLGQHQAMNLAGVSAVLLSQGFSWADIQAGISQLSLPKGRLQVSSLMDDCLLIDDSYNANPSSMLSAVQVLADVTVDQRFLVLGDMAELGDDAVEGHHIVGETARRLGIDQLWTTGRYANEYAQAFGAHTVIAESHALLAQDLRQKIEDVRNQGHSCAVLIKGSRSSQMEKVIALLKDS